MSDALRWLGYLLLAFIVLVVCVFTAYRLRGPSRAQRDALALMQKDYRPTHGTNAFPLLWFMRYDVPEDALDARMADEVAHVSKRLAEGEVMSSYEPLERKLPEASGDPSRLCDAQASACLAKVRADTQAMRSTLATYPVTRAREKAFETTDFYWTDFPVDWRAVLVAYPGDAQRVWLSAYALKYADGDRANALSDVCRNIGTWRRLRGGTNSLVGSMISIREVDGGLRLFADMLAELPPDETVPSECGLALKSIGAADVDRCGEMAGEMKFSPSGFEPRANASWWERAESWIMFDPRQTNAWRAERYADYCGKTATERMLADVPLSAEALPQVTHRAECISSVLGCVLADIARPLYINYDTRTLDFAAHLRLAATLLWLRESAAGEPLAQRFDARPETLRSGGRNSGYDAGSGTLFVENLHGPRDMRYELPVAPNGH